MKIKEWQKEKTTLHLLTQILGKHKLATAYQEPQWGHAVLDLTVQGISTGLLHYKGIDYQININLREHRIEIILTDDVHYIPLKDGVTVKSYYEQITEYLEKNGVTPSLNLRPQEMESTIPLDEDEEHHHYDEEKAEKAFDLMKFAFRAESKFLNPLRSRKVMPGLFWGTFDVSCILVKDDHIPFEDETKVIEVAAFDESMIEFGFWFGDDNFEGPTFFVLPYPFSNRKFECDESFPKGSYYDENLAEFVITLEDLGQDIDKAGDFFQASLDEFKDYLRWQNCEHFYLPLKMTENYSCKDRE